MPRLNFLLKEKFPSILWLTKKEKNLYWNQLIYVFENIRKIYRAHSPSISFLEKALFIIAHFERPHSINDMSNCKIRGSFLQISCLAAGGHRKKRGNRYTFNRLFSIQCAFECRFAAISVTVSERTFSEYKYIISHLSVCGVCVCVLRAYACDCCLDVIAKVWDKQKKRIITLPIVCTLFSLLCCRPWDGQKWITSFCSEARTICMDKRNKCRRRTLRMTDKPTLQCNRHSLFEIIIYFWVGSASVWHVVDVCALGQIGTLEIFTKMAFNSIINAKRTFNLY